MQTQSAESVKDYIFLFYDAEVGGEPAPGQMASFELLPCRDDGEAAAKARELLQRHPARRAVEVRHGEREVLRLTSSPPD